MKVTREQRQQAEERANEVQLRLYAEPEAGEQLWMIATQYGLTEQAIYYNFTQLVGDIILGFYKVSDTLQLIQQCLPNLAPMKQLELEMDIKKFLLPLISPQATLQAEIAEIEQEANNINPKPAPVYPTEPPLYKSSQESLLQPAGSEQTPSPATTPRWETQ